MTNEFKKHSVWVPEHRQFQETAALCTYVIIYIFQPKTDEFFSVDDNPRYAILVMMENFTTRFSSDMAL